MNDPRPGQDGTPASPRPRHQLVELTHARLMEFLREPAAIFWTFGFPILLAVGLGIAFRSQPEQPVRVAVETAGPGSAGERAAQLLERRPGAFELRRLEPQAAAQALRLAQVDLVVGVAEAAPRAGADSAPASAPAPAVDPASTPGAHLVEGASSFRLRYDPSRPEGRMARLAVDAALQQALGRRDVAQIEEKRVFEVGSRYIDFLLPGLLGLNLLSSAMWGLAYSIVQTRRQKLLKRFAATPMRRADYLLSFIFSRLIFLALEVLALFAFGWLAFDIVVRGSWIDLLAISALGGLSFSGLAVLIAARPQSVEVASGWINFIMLPMYLLSGSFFSYSRFPEAIQPLIKILPLTAVNDALRAVINEGAPLHALAPELAVLVFWGVVPFLVAIRIFRWQ